MKDITIHYKNEDITVAWKPGMCIHSTLCWKGLIEVFNPREKPWVKLEAANSDKIKEQINKCPSGALSYTENKKIMMEDNTPNADCTISITPNGPLMVVGSIEIKHTDGRIETKNNSTAFCRCGSSNNKPFCDGTHRKIEFKG